MKILNKKTNKDYTKEPYSFKVNDTTLASDKPLKLGRTNYKNEYW